MNLLGFLAVLTNASMISFVGDQQARQFNIATTSFMERGQKWHLWMSCMVVEHSVLFLRVVLMILSPTEPKWIQEAEETLAFRKVVRYKTNSERQREQRLLDEYKQKMQSCWNILRVELVGKTRQDILAILSKFDVNNDQLVDPSELNEFFLTLGINASDDERLTFIKEIAQYADPHSPHGAAPHGTFEFEHFFKWLLTNEIWVEPVEPEPEPEPEPEDLEKPEDLEDPELEQANGFPATAALDENGVTPTRKVVSAMSADDDFDAGDDT